MNRAWLVAGLFVVGCGGGVTRQELDLTRDQLEAKIAKDVSAVKNEITGASSQIGKLLEVESRVKIMLTEMQKLQQQLQELSKELSEKSEKAATSALKVLEFEEKLLSERLADLKVRIQDLKK